MRVALPRRISIIIALALAGALAAALLLASSIGSNGSSAYLYRGGAKHIYGDGVTASAQYLYRG